MGFDLCIHPLKIWESIGTPTLKMGVHLGVWGFISSHFFVLLGAWDVTPEFPSWFTTLQAFALVLSSKLGLRQFWVLISRNGKIVMCFGGTLDWSVVVFHLFYYGGSWSFVVKLFGWKMIVCGDPHIIDDIYFIALP